MAAKMKILYYLSAAFLFLLSAMTSVAKAGVPLPRYEALMKQQSQSEQLGLYNVSDKVVILTSANFKDTVLQQNRSSLVEFYNSYCGHCKRFAPVYKELAEQIYPWREVLPVCALDCAAEENNEICREYEVMAYPTLRYFGPGYAASAGNYGHKIDTQLLPEIREQVALWLESENRTASMSDWPNMQNLTMSEATSLFKGLDNQRQFIVLVYEPDNSTLGTESVLHFQRWPGVQVRRVNDNEVAAKFQIDGTNYKIATIDRHGTIVPYKPVADTPQAYAATIESFLRSQNLTERPDIKPKVTSTTLNSLLEEEDRLAEAEKAALIAEVKKNKHFIYQADLEMAIRGVLFNEIPKVADINGERLLALQRFLAILQRYNPLGTNGRALVTNLYEFVMQFNQHLTGKSFEDELHRLEKKLSPIFSATHFVGCSASVPGLRGFTCSLWTLFHFLTVQAARREISQDPLEVLQSMHGYVKYFFGCTECTEHFQAMATRRKIWSTPNKDEAVLWLWAAHNEVNQRLSKDSTEDPHFPKIQFPSQSSCSQCYKQAIVSPANLDINWNKDAVLSFLKNIHNPEYVSRYGVDHEELLPSTIEKLRQKRMIGNVFSDIDMRMGMLLYGFCIVMMVVAFKLFAFKGYRKKPYGHDMLGKV